MIKDQLTADLKAAMKSGDSMRRGTIGLILSVVKNRELEKRSAIAKKGGTNEEADTASVLTDDEIIAVLGTEAKKRREAIQAYEDAGRAETAEQERQELGVIMSYLPAQLSEDDLRAIVQQVVAEVHPASAADMGKVIGAVMAKVKGKADGTTVQRLVREVIGT